MQKIAIVQNDAGRRLDRFLRKYLRNAPLSGIYRIIRKDVKVNGKREGNEYVLQEGDEITLYISDDLLEAYTARPKSSTNKRSKKTFHVVFEDENILLADKPFGLLTHGDRNEKKNHLANQVKDYLIGSGEYDPRERIFTPAPANRLDRNTTGLVVFGKNSEALRSLNSMIRGDGVAKFYRTIVVGNLNQRMELHARLEKDTEANKVSILSEEDEAGRAIETIVTPIQMLRGATLVEVELVTGRTHQIRAHLASIGHPVVGDTKYAGTARARSMNRELREKTGLATQLLHSYRLEIRDGEGGLSYLTGESFVAPLPEQFNRVMKELEVL